VSQREIIKTGERTETCNFYTNDIGVFSVRTAGPANTGFWIDWGDGSDREWVMHVGVGTDVTSTHDYSGLAGTKKVTFTGVLDIFTRFQAIDTSLSGDMSAFSNFYSLTRLSLYNSGVTGNISSLSYLTELTYIDVASTSVVGDISVLSGILGLVTLDISGTSISGNISVFSGLPSISQLFVGGSSVTGNISSLSGLTAMTWLYLHSTALTGDIGSLSALTSLVRLYFHTTAITGNINQIRTLVNLTHMYGYSSSVGVDNTALAPWSSSTINLYSCSWTAAEVDDFLISLNTAGGSNGTLNIAGTNAVRTVASDAAKAALLGRGWAITVNE
jgi:hypothetical protein